MKAPSMQMWTEKVTNKSRVNHSYMPSSK